MKDGKGTLTKRARYVAEMCELLAQRAEGYEEAVDRSVVERGVALAYCGYDVGQAESSENIKRMIVQLRMELLELGRMI